MVISPEQYDRMLEALEDAEDAVAFDEAMAEEGPNIPWAQVKAELDWVGPIGSNCDLPRFAH